ncbi:Ergothioneine biosynthesis protein 1, partial [Pseudolycoriella hygida]
MTNGLHNFRIIDISSDDSLTECTTNGGNAPKEDAVNGSHTVDMILASLNQPKGRKSIPTFLLYDELGLQLFDEITRLEEYYLTNAERTILLEHADELASRVNDRTIIVELGSGSLTKTQLIPRAMECHKKFVTYYALDLNRNELERSLSSLGDQFNYVKLIGLLGTYEQAIPWLKQHFCGVSSEAVCSPGITNKFILNGLSHVNKILDEPIFNMDDFLYHSTYQENYGRHVAHFRAKRPLNLEYHKCNTSTIKIPVDQGELIHLEFSHKYNVSEIGLILEAADLDLVQTWSDSKFLY